MNLSNIKISRKLGAGFGAVLLLLLALTAIACFRFEQISDQLDEVFLDSDPKLGHLRTIKDALNDNATDMGELILQADPQARGAAERRMTANTAAIAEALRQLDASIRAPQARELFVQLTAQRQQFLLQRNALLALAEQGERDKALAMLLNEIRASQRECFATLAKLSAFQTELRNGNRATADQLADSGAKVTLSIAAAALTLGALVAWAISRSITVPLAAAAATARRVAAGDLSDHPCPTGKDETGQLLASLQHMTLQLRAIVGQVRSGSSGIARAAGEIAAGNLDLSNRTERQAGALEETASSMEEMTAAVRQSVEHARHANELAAGASDAAQRGGEVVAQVVQTMANISDAAHQIADIIGVIDGIAFQTNILALNAAVEAARAGEEGRGFAVVASEVRNLAQRSATAAKDIKQLIGNANAQVAQGSQMVARAGEEMQGIMHQIVSVSDVMREIVAASEEQGSGIAQINDAITQMDQVTQQNAALVEQSAAAAASMREQSEQLVDAVAVFQLDDEARPAAHRPAPRPRPHAGARRLALA